MGTYLLTQSMLVLNFIEYFKELNYFTYTLLLSFVPFFLLIIFDLYKKNKKQNEEIKYQKKLKDVIISESHNSLFYEGKVNEGAKTLTKKVTENLHTDRCSIWLYNQDKSSIICKQLYVLSDNNWYSNIELFRSDFVEYFDHLEIDPIIVANDAETNKATSCFLDSYLKPLGIKSMLDVPILYLGNVIGVICIESTKKREWKDSEVNFAQMLSTLYSFAYSIREGSKKTEKIKEMDSFIEEASLVSKTDKFGKIIYVNKKFEDVSGWTLSEVLGKDHSIVNSGFHPKKMWSDMYNQVLKDKKTWNKIITNKAKDGHLYYVDTFIKAEFDQETGDLLGFISIRQDVSEIVEALNEIDKKNTYLEHAAKILRHDMHSGINTYIPRGISSLERRLTEEDIKNLKIEAPLKMIKEGLKHTQKVYKGVYEFTNLVKKDSSISKSECSIKKILEDYLSSTSYKSSVMLDDNLPTIPVNESLFCTSLDNLIRNGLKYNDSDTKFVKVFRDGDFICIVDNGRGMTQKDFNELSKPYVRKKGQKETGTGLGLNICNAILKEHGFSITSEKLKEGGTRLKIKFK